MRCFKKYDINVALNKLSRVFDMIININIETSIIQKSEIYKLKCKECDKVYVKKTGRRFELRMREQERREGGETTNSLYARHCINTGQEFINPYENVEIIKVKKFSKKKLYEEFEIL